MVEKSKINSMITLSGGSCVCCDRKQKRQFMRQSIHDGAVNSSLSFDFLIIRHIKKQCHPSCTSDDMFQGGFTPVFTDFLLFIGRKQVSNLVLNNLTNLDYESEPS